MSLQVCHCGWSKKTTYHGLRTHQGMMGCTPKGLRIPENEFRINNYLPRITYMGPPIKLEEPVMDIFTSSMKSDSSSDMSLQVCHCGWSKKTTYHGLRTHQGMMGCTPKGLRIPENEFRINNYLPRITYMGPPIKLEEPVMDIFTSSMKSDSSSDMSLQVCHCGWSKVTTYHGLRTHQGMMGCTPKTISTKDSRPANSATVKTEPLFTPVPQTLATQMCPPAAEVTLKETNKPFFQTPERTQQTAANLGKVRRALDFATGAQQVEQVVCGPPTTTAQETAACPKKEREEEKKKEREAQKLLKAKQDRRRAELQQKIQIREHEVAEVKLSVKGCKGSLDTEWLEINNAFSEVMKVVEDAWQKALQPLEERRRKVKREGQDLVQKLEREINKLKKDIDELDKNPDLQVSLDESRDWKNVGVDTLFAFGSLRATTSAMMEQIHQKLEKLSSVELKRIPTFAVDVKLDPATAHKGLVLSDDGKSVRDGGKIQKLPDTPERFDLFGSVMGLNSLTSGRSYWEVEVSNKTGWDLGVARGDANRKGKLSLSPDNGYWVTVHYEDKQYAALTAPPVSLSLKEKPQKVGVFVDHEEGVVSFYDVTAQSHIYSFTECSFGGEIFPYFSPHLKQNGKNSDPLIISAVKRQ